MAVSSQATRAYDLLKELILELELPPGDLVTVAVPEPVPCRYSDHR